MLLNGQSRKCDNIFIYGKAEALEKLDVRQTGTGGNSEPKMAEQKHKKEADKQKDEAAQNE